MKFRIKYVIKKNLRGAYLSSAILLGFLLVKVNRYLFLVLCLTAL